MQIALRHSGITPYQRRALLARESQDRKRGQAMNRIRLLRVIFLALLATTPLLTATAQDNSEEGPSVYPVELKEDSQLEGGESAFLQGEADIDGHRFTVPESQVLQPISVWAFSKDPTKTVRLRVVKDSWEQPERDIDTGNPRGIAEVHFRTYDGFKLWVTAEEPTSYVLIVWKGEEIELPIAPLAMPMSQYRESNAAANADGALPASEAAGKKGFALSYLEAALAVLLLLLGAGFTAYVLMRRKTS